MEEGNLKAIDSRLIVISRAEETAPCCSMQYEYSYEYRMHDSLTDW